MAKVIEEKKVLINGVWVVVKVYAPSKSKKDKTPQRR